jgi:hypothetical protein
LLPGVGWNSSVFVFLVGHLASCWDCCSVSPSAVAGYCQSMFEYDSCFASMRRILGTFCTILGAFCTVLGAFCTVLSAFCTVLGAFCTVFHCFLYI